MSMFARLSRALRPGHRIGVRTTSSAAVLGLVVASLAAAPGIAAASTATPPAPTQYTTSPAPMNGNSQDPCGQHEPYGYIGLSPQGVTFSAVVNGGSTDSQVAAHFQIWPTDSPATVTDATSSALPPGDTVSVSVADSVFTDGGTYAWRVRDEAASGVSDWTQPCHFVRVLTPPSPPTITSSTFPATGSAPIRTYGTFTFSVPTPTRVVGFQYVLNGTLSVGPGNPYVPIGADGTATTPPLASAQWGTNSLEVQSIDIAGDVSGVATYLFYLVDTRTTPDKHADLNGDGNPDLVAVGADGGLYYAAGLGNGQVATPTAETAPAPRYPAGWNPSLIAVGGDFSNDWFEDLAVIQNGSLYLYRGTGLGDFHNPVFVQPPSTQANWSGAAQLLSPGDLNGDGRADLVIKQGTQLLFLAGFFGGSFDDPVPAASGDWSGMTVVGITDVTGDGIPDLIARADKSGVLWLYPGVGDGTFGGVKTRVCIGSGLDAAHYPLLVTKGDVTGDGYADIWAVGKSGDLFLVKGKSGGHCGRPAVVSSSPFWKGVTALG
jgi:hypothetical protein